MYFVDIFLVVFLYDIYAGLLISDMLLIALKLESGSLELGFQELDLCEQFLAKLFLRRLLAVLALSAFQAVHGERLLYFFAERVGHASELEVHGDHIGLEVLELLFHGDHVFFVHPFVLLEVLFQVSHAFLHVHRDLFAALFQPCVGLDQPLFLDLELERRLLDSVDLLEVVLVVEARKLLLADEILNQLVLGLELLVQKLNG